MTVRNYFFNKVNSYLHLLKKNEKIIYSNPLGNKIRWETIIIVSQRIVDLINLLRLNA